MQEHNHPVDTLVAEWVKELNADLREAFEERAAIIEFDGMKDRAHAECLALLDVIRRHPMAIQGVTVLQIEQGEETQWLVTTDLDFARGYLEDIGGIEREVLSVSEVVHSQYGGLAQLAAVR